MIAFLRGILRTKSPTEAVVEANGLGFTVLIPVSTYERLGEPGSAVTLHTHLHMREDALQLYGFATGEERAVFRMLIGVNGVGPRMAQGILSGMSAGDFRGAIIQGNVAALTSIPGVGRKTAERLIVELKERIGRAGPPTPVRGETDGQARIRSEVLMALTSLGFTRPAAEQALRSALAAAGHDGTVEELVKSALRQHTGRRE